MEPELVPLITLLEAGVTRLSFLLLLCVSLLTCLACPPATCSIPHIPYRCHTHNTLAAQATPYPTSSPARAEMAMPAPRSAAVQIRAPPAEPVREFVPAAKPQGDANGIFSDGKKKGACGSVPFADE